MLHLGSAVFSGLFARFPSVEIRFLSGITRQIFEVAQIVPWKIFDLPWRRPSQGVSATSQVPILW
jgi:hypothetical protein